MKQLVLAFIVLFAMPGCKSDNTPEKAAEKFLKAFNEKNYAEARKYGTPETNKLVDLMESLSKMSTSIDSIPHNKIEVISSKVDGENASVTFREEGADGTEQLKMIKKDGKWLVHITKADISAKENSVFNTDEEGLMMEPGEYEGLPDDTSGASQAE